MSALVERLIASLHEWAPPDLREVSIDAGLLLDRRLFNMSDAVFQQHVHQLTVDPDLAGTALSDDELVSLIDALVGLLQRRPYGVAGQAVQLLGLVREQTLKPVFIESLRFAIGVGDAGTAYAALQALDRLGEDVFGGRQSRSAIDWGLNRELALAYLQQQEPLPPLVW